MYTHCWERSRAEVSQWLGPAGPKFCDADWGVFADCSLAEDHRATEYSNDSNVQSGKK